MCISITYFMNNKKAYLQILLNQISTPPESVSSTTIQIIQMIQTYPNPHLEPLTSTRKTANTTINLTLADAPQGGHEASPQRQ